MARKAVPDLINDDAPELTDAELAELRPAAEVLPPAIFAMLAKRRPGQRGAGKNPAKEQVTLRLDRAVLEVFRADGAGWQGRINEALRRAAGQ